MRRVCSAILGLSLLAAGPASGDTFDERSQVLAFAEIVAGTWCEVDERLLFSRQMSFSGKVHERVENTGATYVIDGATCYLDAAGRCEPSDLNLTVASVRHHGPTTFDLVGTDGTAYRLYQWLLVQRTAWNEHTWNEHTWKRCG